MACVSLWHIVHHLQSDGLQDNSEIVKNEQLWLDHQSAWLRTEKDSIEMSFVVVAVAIAAASACPTLPFGNCFYHLILS